MKLNLHFIFHSSIWVSLQCSPMGTMFGLEDCLGASLCLLLTPNLFHLHPNCTKSKPCSTWLCLLYSLLVWWNPFRHWCQSGGGLNKCTLQLIVTLVHLCSSFMLGTGSSRTLHPSWVIVSLNLWMGKLIVLFRRRLTSWRMGDRTKSVCSIQDYEMHTK